MNAISVLLLMLLAGLLVMSYRQPIVGTLGFLVLIPLYYVLRGTSGQTAFAFLWPYLFLAALTHVLGILALTASTGTRRLVRNDRRALVALYVALAVACVIWLPLVITTLTQPVEAAINQFNDYRVVVFGLLACILIGWPLLTALRRQPLWIRRLTVLDWAMVAFVAYGGFQLLVSLVRTEHLFYSLESFRYYFLMAWTYFVVRFGLRCERDARLVVAIVAGVAVVVAAEFTFEHFLFNYGVSSLRLPWLRALDSLFAGYGRPAPVESFALMTARTETEIVPYSGIRGIGLFMHPHTAGLFMTIGAGFVATWVFDARRRGWPWLLLALSVLTYGVVLTMSRAAAMLLYAVLMTAPLAVAWTMRSTFARRRALPYALTILATVYVASHWSPGGYLPHFRLGWYERPIVFSVRAATGDMLAWNTPAMAALPGAMPEPTVGPGAMPEPTVGPGAMPEPTVGSEDHDTTPADQSLLRGSRVLASKLNLTVLLIGRGFSPLTRYVVDFFPEAAGNRHLSSTADVVLLEFFQQFGLIGLGLLLAMFGAFSYVGVRDAHRWSGQPASAIALGTVLTAVVTVIGLLHLYPLFRTGVNTTIYALLGVFGFLHADRGRWAGSARDSDRSRP